MASQNLDFSSSLYLGFEHGSYELPSWRQFTLGVPSAIRTWPDAGEIEDSFAKLVGTESALLGRSTFHSLWDLAGSFDPSQTAVIIDEQAYPILYWGAGRLVQGGSPVFKIPHFDSSALGNACEQSQAVRRRPIVFTDSFCCNCGRHFSMASCLQYVTESDGLLVLDDTHGLGIFGTERSVEFPLGFGGGGCLRRAGINSGNVVLVSSLAKAFGSPASLLCGTKSLIHSLRHRGSSRWHCSQPSRADLDAASAAFDRNACFGDNYRARLMALISNFQQTALEQDLKTNGSGHPSQCILLPREIDAAAISTELRKSGLACLPSRSHRGRPGLVLQLTVQHSKYDIHLAVCLIFSALSSRRFEMGKSFQKFF